jgi:acid stress-induced BolA-like protein IbaG/YrbA
VSAAEEIKSLIEQSLDAAHVEVADTGGGDHFQALVVSSAFEGKSRVQQHQLVYRALGDNMRERIHALALRTLTPGQWQEGTR